MDIDKFRKLPIMGILRGIERDALDPLTECIISSGLKTIEITMNTKHSAELIRQMRKVSGDSLTVGAGTVLSMEDLRKALDVGAEFIVIPTLAIEVVEYCVKKSIAVFPGAFSPQEIYNVWRAGATMVKVFPAKFFGPTYLSQIKGPFSDIELLACGGVDADNIRSFFANGASAVAFGGSVFRKDWIKQQKFSYIKDRITTILAAFNK